MGGEAEKCESVFVERPKGCPWFFSLSPNNQGLSSCVGTYVIVIERKHTQLREDGESIEGRFAQKIVTRNQTTQFCEFADVLQVANNENKGLRVSTHPMDDRELQ